MLRLNTFNQILNGLFQQELSEVPISKVKDVCLSKGFAVITVNGDGLKLFLPNLQMFNYHKDCELNEKLRFLMVEKALHKFPLALTGNICIGRGISIMSNDFMIDYAILTVTGKHQEVSQISGRLKGNIKSWHNYKKPIVYTTNHFDKIATEWEKKSRNLAVLTFRKQQEGDLTIIKKSEFKTAGEDFEYIIHSERFKRYTHAQEFLLTKSREMKTKTRISKNGAIKMCNGYSVSTRLESINGKKKEQLTEDDRLLDDDKHL